MEHLGRLRPPSVRTEVFNISSVDILACLQSTENCPVVRRENYVVPIFLSVAHGHDDLNRRPLGGAVIGLCPQFAHITAVPAFTRWGCLFPACGALLSSAVWRHPSNSQAAPRLLVVTVDYEKN